MKNWMINTIIDELEELEDTTIETQYAGDSIFERASIDGSFTMSHQKAWDWVNKYHDDLRFFLPEHWEYITSNPLTETEAFMVEVMIEYTSEIMCQVIENLEITSDTIKLDRAMLSQIEVELGKIK